MTEHSEDAILLDDPVLGRFIANYPADRGRLLLTGGAVLAVVWFVVTVALWQVEAETAFIITVVILGIAALGVGWYITHFWNREVILYEGGFSYREGSHTAFVRHHEIRSIRQRGERVAYFGGLLRRTRYQLTITTEYDEIITLTTLYRRLDELAQRLEAATIRVRKPEIERRLDAGERLAFADSLQLSAGGLHHNGRELPWGDFGGYRVTDGRLVILARSGDQTAGWHSVALGEVDNLRLLVELLREAQPQTSDAHNEG
jgi:hypothetical protein